MSDYRFCVSLHVSHPTLDLEVLNEIIGLKPSRLRKLGEPRVSLKGTPLSGVYKSNLWTAPLHEKKRLLSSEIYLEDYLENMNQKFLPHKEKFHEIVSTGGYIEYFIGLFSECSIGTTLNPKLLKATAELSISIGLDIYAYEE